MNTFAREDLYDLDRFVQAQKNIYEGVISELRQGHKRSHWMWFIFPQIDGLGRSITARKYAIKSPGEARAYLDHEILGSRLMECTKTVLDLRSLSVSEIFGYPDDMKFRSSMTLFEAVTHCDSVFSRALDHYFDGKRDARTLELAAGQ